MLVILSISVSWLVFKLIYFFQINSLIWKHFLVHNWFLNFLVFSLYHFFTINISFCNRYPLLGLDPIYRLYPYCSINIYIHYRTRHKLKFIALFQFIFFMTLYNLYSFIPFTFIFHIRCHSYDLNRLTVYIHFYDSYCLC